MVVQKIFQKIVNDAAAKVRPPEIKTGFFGIKKEDAANAVEQAINDTAKQIGQDIIAEYNKVTIKRYGSKTVKTTTEFNGVTNETFLKGSDGKEYLSRYQRTTPKGTYTINYREDGAIEKTKIESPLLGVKETYYTNGKLLKVKSVDDLITLEKRHEANKGSIIDHSVSTRDYNKKIYHNEYSNGSREAIETTLNEKPFYKRIILKNGSQITKDLESNVTTFTEMINKDTFQYFSHLAYHINPKTGQRSTTQLTKIIDELGRPVIKVDYDIAKDAGISDVKLVYSIPSKNVRNYMGERDKIISASFKSDDLGKVEFINGDIIINGETKDNTFIHELYKKYAPKSSLHTSTGAFELLLKEALENNGVSRKLFLPENKVNWPFL